MRYKIFFIDFDGVFTDNKVHIDINGDEYVTCSRSDGMGLSDLKASGIDCIIVSSEKIPLCQLRAAKLNIVCYNEISDKKDKILSILKDKNISPVNSVFLGNDVNDIPAFSVVDLKLAVADSHPEILHQADFVLSSCGGDGAVREAAQLILLFNKKFS